MRLLICGDRNWTDREIIAAHLLGLVVKKRDQSVVVIHGAARGADSLASDVARNLGIPVEEYPADWNTYGKKAGILRNLQMLDTKPDEVWAYHDDISQSKGTKHTYNEARKRGIPTMLYAHRGDVETGIVDPTNPLANMYGALPCPKCRGEYRTPLNTGVIECADCDFTEPIMQSGGSPKTGDGK